MKSVDLDIVQNIIVETAATEILPRFRKLGEGDIEMKGVNDPVTVADKGAEAALIARLTDYLPGSVVVGEESFASDPDIVAHFSGDHDVWVIDPIDGTRNFVAGDPDFGTMVGLVRKKETVAAWIHGPVSGDTIMAERGGGVWLGENRMRLAAHENGAATVGLAGSRFRKFLKKPEYAGIAAKLPPLDAGAAAAFDYARLFTGERLFAGSAAARAGFIVYRETKPWDHVPGLFLLEEGGGYAANLFGEPYDYGLSKKGLLIAPDREKWEGIHGILAPLADLITPE
ncbi:MAG: inositol monophosphatase [Alphaproteobacteria bacterium]|nr:inositol monophosphatase [Alphaproteobacteria bacterium]